jgi:hypothetical protein
MKKKKTKRNMEEIYDRGRKSLLLMAIQGTLQAGGKSFWHIPR